MLTQCPNCETIYRLGAADLGAAQGFVECGECGAEFNAIGRLADEPKFPHEASAPSTDPDAARTHPQNAEIDASSGPTFVLLDSGETAVVDESVPTREDEEPEVIDETSTELGALSAELEQASLFEARPETSPEQDPESEIAPDTAAAIAHDAEPELVSTDVAAQDPVNEMASAVEEPEPAIVDIAESPSPTLSESEHAILFTDPSDEFKDDDAADLDQIDIDEVPAILQDEVAALKRQPKQGLRWLWIVLALLLLIGLSLQFAWVFRRRIIATTPDVLPVYLSACDRLGCRIDTASGTDQIELLARDVRDHPQYRDTLLVNATLVSHSETTTLFPVILLGLFGQTGDVIGIRRFEPREYLDKSIDLSVGMPPNRSVYIVLEVAGVGPRAVSFEFTFL